MTFGADADISDNLENVPPSDFISSSQQGQNSGFVDDYWKIYLCKKFEPFLEIWLEMSNKRKVSYFYDPEVGNYHYGAGHPMKPHRIQITNSLVFDYGLHKHMAIYTPAKSSEFELMRYHSREYKRVFEMHTDHL